ncbi:MAG: hypothetical protein QXM12_01300 [Nitrososphaerota archaeon]
MFTFVTLFLPGIIILFILRKNLNFSVSESIVFGSIIWNYVFFASSLILGFFNGLLKVYFFIFPLISILLVFIFLIVLVVSMAVSRHLTMKISLMKSKIVDVNLQKFFLFISYSFFILFNFSLLYYHPIMYEWDAVNIYIPAAKSIKVSGNLFVNVYRQLNFLDASPMIPLLYAYVIYHFDLDSVFTIPAVFFFLTVLSIWILAKELLDEGLAALAPLVFLSIPLVQISLGARALYLDIPFNFYILAVIIALIKLQKNSKSFANLFLIALVGMSSSLMLLTRLELGLFIVLPILVTFLIISDVKLYGLFFVLALNLPYILREVRNVLISNNIEYLLRLTPLLPMSLFFVMLLLKVRLIIHQKTSFNLKSLPLLLVLLAPSAIFFIINNLMKGGFIISGVPISGDLIKALHIYSKFNPSSSSFSILNMFSWQNMFIVWWSVVPLIVPFMLGIFSILHHLIKYRALDSTSIPLLTVFLGIFALWSQLGCDPQPRRLYLFSMFLALLTSYGFSKLRGLYHKEFLAFRVITYLIISLLTVWTKNSIKVVSDMILLYPKTLTVVFDPEIFLYSIFYFVIIFFPYEKYIKIDIKRSLVNKLQCLFLSSLLISSNFFVPILIDMIKTSKDSRYKILFSTYTYPEVVQYYKEKIHDSYSTICFYCHELITFANRSVIDLYNPIYSSFIYLEIENFDEIRLFNLFKSLNVGYLLLPNENNMFFEFYQNIFNRTSIEALLRYPRTEPIARFRYVTLYRVYLNYSITFLNYSRPMP